MFADALPPPTYCFDWDLLPWPASLIVPLAFSAALVTFFLLVARRVRIGWKVVLFLLCALLFVIGDYIVYEIGLKLERFRPQPPPILPDQQAPKSSQSP